MARALINVPQTAKRGEVIEIKALIAHPMETGYRAGAERHAASRATSSAASPAPMTARRSSAPSCFPADRRQPVHRLHDRRDGERRRSTFTWTDDNGFDADRDARRSPST